MASIEQIIKDLEELAAGSGGGSSSSTTGGESNTRATKKARK